MRRKEEMCVTIIKQRTMKVMKMKIRVRKLFVVLICVMSKIDHKMRENSNLRC